MIATPYRFEANLTETDYQKIGQFALRWSTIEHTIGNCLRRLIDLDPKQASVIVFPLSLDLRMQRIELLSKIAPFTDEQAKLFGELKPLIRAMQYLRTTALHGIVIDLGGDHEPYFELRSKGSRKLTKAQLFSCEELINYTAHVVSAFRVTLGEKDASWGPSSLSLPERPPIPEFLPDDCRAFPKANTVRP